MIEIIKGLIKELREEFSDSKKVTAVEKVSYVAYSENITPKQVFIDSAEVRKFSRAIAEKQFEKYPEYVPWYVERACDA